MSLLMIDGRNEVLLQLVQFQLSAQPLYFVSSMNSALKALAACTHSKD